jgi:hypothetical protein
MNVDFEEKKQDTERSEGFRNGLDWPVPEIEIAFA